MLFLLLPRPTLFPYTTLFRSRAESPLRARGDRVEAARARAGDGCDRLGEIDRARRDDRSEEHTSELQSRRDLVCRLLLEKKKNAYTILCRSFLRRINFKIKFI